NSPAYGAPLLVSNSCCLQARLFVAGRATGAVAIANFVLLETNLAGFTSTIPVICLHTFGHPIPGETGVVASLRFVDGNPAHPATPGGVGSFDGRALVK